VLSTPTPKKPKISAEPKFAIIFNELDYINSCTICMPAMDATGKVSSWFRDLSQSLGKSLLNEWLAKGASFSGTRFSIELTQRVDKGSSAD
jgi:hypothetical protein